MVRKVTDKAYFDVTVGDDTTNTSRIVIGLFGDIVPETVSNFKMLVTNEKGYGFQGTNFYRIVKDLQISGGDVLKNAGKTGKSALNGDVFPQVLRSCARCLRPSPSPLIAPPSLLLGGGGCETRPDAVGCKAGETARRKQLATAEVTVSMCALDRRISG